MTAELTRFLNDRYDAIEADAELAGGDRWIRDGGSITHERHPSDDVVDWVYGEGWAHIARHDPASVIADLGSKRRIVNLLSPTWVSHCLDSCDICAVGRELAEPFADMDGWREDWRPVREGELLT